MAALVDTNVLVYVYDPRLPAKQDRAAEILIEGLKADTVRLPHQAIGHMWAYAEVYGLSELWSEDFQHDRLYGTVRAVNPFL